MNEQAVVLNNLYKSLQLPKAMYLPFRIEDEEKEKRMDVEEINFLLSTSSSLSKLDEIKIINLLLTADKSKIESRILKRSLQNVLIEKSSFLCWILARAYLREHKYVEAKKLLDISVTKNNSIYQYYDEMSNLLFLMLEYTHSAFVRKFSLFGNHVYKFYLWDDDVNFIKTLFQFDPNNKLYSYSNHFYLVNNSNTIKVLNGEVYEFKNNRINNFLYQNLNKIKSFEKLSNNLIQVLANSNILKFLRATLKLLGAKLFINSKFCDYLIIKVNHTHSLLRNFLAKFKNKKVRYEYKKNRSLYSFVFRLIKTKLSKKYTFVEIVHCSNNLEKNLYHAKKYY